MTLPEVMLDDRRFQDLVNEARARIAQSCPEWTEHNVSDPGVTLIELFAWMTDTLIYRLNRIPDKLHVALLDLLGVQLAPPAAASTDLRFRLSAPSADTVVIPGGATEVATPRVPGEDPVVFQTLVDAAIPPLAPIAYAVERGGAFKSVAVAAGTARPRGGDELPFGSPPQPGDALYLGFDAALDRLLLRVVVDCSQARGAGVDPEDPPLAWEVSTGEHGPGGFEPLDVLLDTTGGFNYGSGVVEVEVTGRSGLASVAGTRAHWIRCRVDQATRTGATGAAFTHPPQIHAIGAAPIGATVPAVHAAHVHDERLELSDGTPGQRLALRHRPLIEPGDDDVLEVLAPGAEDWERWQRVESFADSGPEDRHYVLDLATGTVELGPAVRGADGRWVQYGATPPKGAQLRMRGYRHGGGRAGNVAAGALTVLRAGIPGIDTVTNPQPARGGVDPGSLDSLRQQAALELRTRYRAVTREDFEVIARRASPRVARAICVPPTAGGAIRVHIVPRVEPADRLLTHAELTPDEALLGEVAAYVDERRLLGTTVECLPAKYRGVSVVVNVQASAHADRQRIERDVVRALEVYLNPICGGSVEGLGDGWEFGRALNQGELFAIVHSVPGVEYVKVLRIYETDLATGEQQPKPAGTHLVIEADEVIASGEHVVRAEYRDQ